MARSSHSQSQSLSLFVTVIACGLAVVLPASCALRPADDGGGGAGDEDDGPDAAAYTRDHVIEIDVTMGAADWAELLAETRSVVTTEMPGCTDAPPRSPFRRYDAAVTIDGTEFEKAQVKKRGFLGSVSPYKPALKLDLNEVDKDAAWNGVDNLVLANSIQDPSYLHTCLAYDVFRDAGVPAPRCNFAHVVVNGQDYGLYVHVEAVRKGFVRRAFGDDDGALYEGTNADFAPTWLGTFEDKLGDDDAPPSPALAAIAQASAADLPDLVDVDEFRAFQAVEALLSDWDGYSGNHNNFFVYVDAKTSLTSFIPWGPDQTFVHDTGMPLESVMANGAVAGRLYADAAGRAAYEDTLKSLLDTVWDEDALAEKLDRMDAVVQPYMHDGFEADAQKEWSSSMRDFIAARRGQIQGELSSSSAPDWPQAPQEHTCAARVGGASGTFGAGSGAVAGDLGGAAFDIDADDGAVVTRTSSDDGRTAIAVAGAALTLVIDVRTAELATPGPHEVDDSHVSVIVKDSASGAVVGRAYAGTVDLDDADSGSFSVDFVDVGF